MATYHAADYCDSDGGLLVPCAECDAPCSGALTGNFGEPLCGNCRQQQRRHEERIRLVMDHYGLDRQAAESRLEDIMREQAEFDSRIIEPC